MRISDWSSDVCSSDLRGSQQQNQPRNAQPQPSRGNAQQQCAPQQPATPRNQPTAAPQTTRNAAAATPDALDDANTAAVVLATAAAMDAEAPNAAAATREAASHTDTMEPRTGRRHR